MTHQEYTAHDQAPLVEDKALLAEYLYTSIPEALQALEARRADPLLLRKVEGYLDGVVPAHLLREAHAVLARQVVTTNYEVHRFLNVPDGTGLPPLFFEYGGDKLVYKNPYKYHLGKLLFHVGTGKKGGMKSESVSVIDFNASHGKPIKEVRTTWGEPLMDFHHTMFLSKYPQYKDSLFDAHEWYAFHGGSPEAYYKKFLALFICHGILFENFLTDAKEMAFTRDIVLPAFAEVMAVFGLKPLIVALEPTHIEEDIFWYSHPHHMKEFVSGKLEG